jgi:hypothetical protein
MPERLFHLLVWTAAILVLALMIAMLAVLGGGSVARNGYPPLPRSGTNVGPGYLRRQK